MTRLRRWFRPKVLKQQASTIALAVAALVVVGLVASLLLSQPRPSTTSATPLPTVTSGSDDAPEIGLTLPRNPTVVVLGDSWSAGFYADPGQGWVDRVSRELGWDTSVIERGADTGFLTRGIADAGTYLERLSAMGRDPDVDLVVIQGGLNDVDVPDFDTTSLNEAIRQVLKKAHRVYPRAKLLMIGPLNPFTPDPGAVDGVDSRMSREASLAGIPYLSPSKGRWFGDTYGSLERFIGEDRGAHPNNKGHRRFANRVIDELKRLAAIESDRGQ